MNKRPAQQFYPGDWWRANDVKGCSMCTQGVWFNLLMAMWDEQIQGRIRDTKEGICRIIGANLDELEEFVDDNKSRHFANVTFRNKKVTIINRRMYRAYILRNSTKKRVQKHRQQARYGSNGDVTPPSSTSTSISSSKKEYMSIFDEARTLFKGTKRGLQTEYDNFVKKHADWKDVLLLLRPAVEVQIVWRAEDGRYWKNFKTWINNRCWEEEHGVSNAKDRGNSDKPFVR